MDQKKVLISCGPIVAKLDSVKHITNRFKGGLAAETALQLSQKYGFDVWIVACHGTLIPDECSDHPVIRVNDVYDYYEVIKNTKADAYILAAAVANIAPTQPFPWGSGKFPSHNYKEGDRFNIEFTIAPRAIDKVKEWHPNATLIGYKLFDGTEEELVAAAWQTLTHSRSNIVFANHPKTAKKTKIALMPDGTSSKMDFDEHIHFIQRAINLEWYRTKIQKPDSSSNFVKESPLLDQLVARIGVKREGYTFGTAAIRDGEHSFVTTTRGKRESGRAFVSDVIHTERVVYADTKATLNAPALHLLFLKYPEVRYILHGHRQLPDIKTVRYAFSGTTEETERMKGATDTISNPPIFNIENHGYYACFKTHHDMMEWLDANYPN